MDGAVQSGERAALEVLTKLKAPSFELPNIEEVRILTAKTLTPGIMDKLLAKLFSLFLKVFRH